VSLTDDVRASCREIAAGARHVTIDLERLSALEPGDPPALDAERHYLDGPPEGVADYLLVLDSINFGSGWFPTLRKRAGMSGYFTVASYLADLWRGSGGWSADELRALRAEDVAAVLRQDATHELMGLYAEALRDLGRFLGARRAVDLIASAGRSAERLASMLAAGMPFFDDVGFWKRAQITANDLALAGVAEFDDLDRLTIFADNLVPHVLRVDGVLVYEPSLAARIDAGELLPPGAEEREIRGCAVHACELLSERLGMPPRLIDTALWNRGQEPRYKAVQRHRTRTVFY
jgi:Potential Queuosine, Q, salvage protein family